VPEKIQESVLLKSKRRCALCFGLGGDLGEKSGQIAHVDHNSQNNEEQNLVYLCLEHHDQHDSTTRLSKGLTEGEVREYRARLYRAIETGLGPSAARPAENASAARDKRTEEVRKHDREIFRRADAIMSEGVLVAFLYQLKAKRSFIPSSFEPLGKLCNFFRLTENIYINDRLRQNAGRLRQAILELMEFMRVQFHPRIAEYGNPDATHVLATTEKQLFSFSLSLRGPVDDTNYRELVASCNFVAAKYAGYRFDIKQELLV